MSTGGSHVPLVVSYDKNERVYNPPMPLLFQWRRRLETRPVAETSLRKYLDHALTALGVKDAGGHPMRYTFHDFRRLFITDAIMHGMPPHIAQLVAGHRDINTTMGYKAVYPEEVINGHRAFLARRRALRPSEEYRTPTDEEWAQFIGHFEHRKVSIGDCGRSYDTPCIHEHVPLTEIVSGVLGSSRGQRIVIPRLVEAPAGRQRSLRVVAWSWCHLGPSITVARGGLDGRARHYGPGCRETGGGQGRPGGGDRRPGDAVPAPR